MSYSKRIMLALFFVLSFLLPLNAYAFFGLFEDGNIAIVKNGTFNFDKTVTIGNVLDNNPYLYNQEWTSFEDNQKRAFVQFKANIDVKLIEKYSNKKSADIVQSVLSEKSVYDDYIDDTKIILQFVIYEGGKTFDLSYCSLEGKGQELDTEGYNANIVLKEIYGNEMPFKAVIMAMIIRSYAVDSITKTTNNFTQPFYQLSVNSELASILEINSVFSDKIVKWHELGIDTSTSYFKITNLTYDNIELESIFFFADRRGHSKSKVYEYTIENMTLPIEKFRCYNANDFIFEAYNGDMRFSIKKGGMQNELYATISYNKSIEGKMYGASGNVFVCSESAKSSEDVYYEKIYGIYMGKDKETGYYLFEAGGDEVGLVSERTSLFDDYDIGKAYIMDTTNNKILTLEQDTTYRP